MWYNVLPNNRRDGAAKTMAFKSDIKKKEIKIQKQAQSLTAFQSMVAHGIDDRTALMKRLLLAAAAIVLALAAVASWMLWQSHRIGQHETALSALVSEVQGSRSKPNPADVQVQKMRAALPRLEELAKTAPDPCVAVTNGMLAAWKLKIGPDEDSATTPQTAAIVAPKDPWSILRLAQRSIALGQAKEAGDLIATLRKKAKPSAAWAGQYWATLMQVRQLEGNRAQALNDYAEYRSLYKGHPDANALDKALEGI